MQGQFRCFDEGLDEDEARRAAEIALPHLLRELPSASISIYVRRAADADAYDVTATQTVGYRVSAKDAMTNDEGQTKDAG